MTLNSVTDLLARGVVNNLATPYYRIEEEVLAEEGLTRQDLIEFEQKGRNDNKEEWKGARIRAKTYQRLLGSFLGQIPETIFNAIGLDTSLDSIPDIRKNQNHIFYHKV